MSDAAPRPSVLPDAGARDPVNLLTYAELYVLWERQHWTVHDIDFTQDRVDWNERFTARQRARRLRRLGTFFYGEARVADELGPMMRACPEQDMRMFLCTQIADEARHAAFFNRFYAEIGAVESEALAGRLEIATSHADPAFVELVGPMLGELVARVAVDPEDLESLVEAVTLYHMVAEGMVALTGQHVMIAYYESLDAMPGLVAGFTQIARDEHRHVAFGARFLRDMAARGPRFVSAIERTLERAVPLGVSAIRSPSPGEQEAGRAFALQALERRLRAIGLSSLV